MREHGPKIILSNILYELQEKSLNAAKRGKPTMWAYYIRMRRGLLRWFGVWTKTNRPCRHGDVRRWLKYANDGEVAGKALALIQKADFVCPNYSVDEAAKWWALSVYARRILKAWTGKIDGNLRPSLDWLRERATEK